MLSESFKELLRRYSGPRIYRQLHFTYFFIDFFHKVNDEIDKFVLEHLFCVEIGDQETNIVALKYSEIW